MAELFIHRGKTPLLRLPVDRDRLRLGSHAACHLVLPREAAAERQAELVFTEAGWRLKNLCPGGTRLDARTVQEEAPLTDGAVITLGAEWMAVFRASGATSPGETRRRAAAGHTLAAEPPARAAAAPRHLLRWENERGRGELPLTGPLTVGSDEGNDVALDDPFCSAFHARLTPRDGEVWLEDLGSTNGTFVRGAPVHSLALPADLPFRIGQTRLVLTAPRAESGRPWGIVTTSPSLQRVLDQIERVARSDATVTVFGESGTGKELIARALHQASPRRQGPFIPVNCAAISKELIESELFGHEKGAFTGATAPRRGAFEEAIGGTLFLDEVGELPLDLQAKLLRALELKEIRRVGSSRPVEIDVRIVAATNRNLQQEMAAGRFREDLFYRLFVVPLTLPPLRQRPEDLPLLAEHFVRSASLLDPPPVISPGALEVLAAHTWPGNVRELKNTLERALLLGGGERIEADDVTFPSMAPPVLEGETICVRGKTLDEIEREAIHIALRIHGGNRRKTAAALGMARSTLQLRLKEMGIVKESDA